MMSAKVICGFPAGWPWSALKHLTAMSCAEGTGNVDCGLIVACFAYPDELPTADCASAYPSESLPTRQTMMPTPESFSIMTSAVRAYWPLSKCFVRTVVMFGRIDGQVPVTIVLPVPTPL